MLQFPNLNDRTFEELVENAIKQIRTHNGTWTDVDIHDPGITFIELLSHLTVRQQETIDTVGERSLQKFAELVGVERQKAVPATAYISMRTGEDVYIPRGTEFSAFHNVYATQERMFCQRNQICAIGTGVQDAVFLSEHDGISVQRKLDMFGEEEGGKRDFYIVLKKPLLPKEKMCFYMDLFFPEFTRNPLTQKDTFVPLSQVEWQYYGEENGVTDWYPAEICKDETEHLLFSGLLELKIKGVHQSVQFANGIEGAPLRAVLKENGYEQRPILKNILMNVFLIKQKKAMCEEIDISFAAFLENKMLFDSYLAFYGKFELFLRSETGFVKAEDMDILYAVKREENNLFRLGTSERSRLQSYFGDLPQEEVVFRLVCYRDTFFRERCIGSSNGTADKLIVLKDQFRNIVYDTFGLTVQSRIGGQCCWEKWEKTELFDYVGPKEKKYILNPVNAAIKFGNNRNGKVPSRLRDNILITQMELTEDVSGFVQKGAVKAPADPEIFRKICASDAEIYQFIDAFGAKKADDTDAFLQRVIDSAYLPPQRAVTAQDYQYFAKNIPGLIVKRATVIPLYKPHMENYPEKIEENAVTVVIEPPEQENGKKVLKNYMKNAEQYLNRKKLLTTKVYVMASEYYDLDIYTDIVVSFDYDERQQYIRQELIAYLERLQQEELGCTLYHGDFFAKIEQMPQVLGVKYLKLELIGKKMLANQFGDIKIPPYARARIKNVFITLNYK